MILTKIFTIFCLVCQWLLCSKCDTISMSGGAIHPRIEIIMCIF
uniref:Uncharacterized protein n=1 Tax=Myoviridae sp. ctuev19 TaxID=2827716 RepID=A0A8S5SG49_9CAUD|nr:MAG TPA: hypothetical protein [Myoviridae sp. ctuev19]